MIKKKRCGTYSLMMTTCTTSTDIIYSETILTPLQSLVTATLFTEKFVSSNLVKTLKKFSQSNTTTFTSDQKTQSSETLLILINSILGTAIQTCLIITSVFGCGEILVTSKGLEEDFKQINSLCSNLLLIQHVHMEEEKGIAERLIMKLLKKQLLSYLVVVNISNMICNMVEFIQMRMKIGQHLQCLKCKSIMMNSCIILNNLLKHLISNSLRALMN